MLQTFDFSGSRIINAKGRFFRYVSGSAGGADNRVTLSVNGNPIGVYSPGDSVELDDTASTWSVDPITPACTGSVIVGMGKVSSSTFSGSVTMASQGPFTQQSKTVTNTSGQLVAANPARRYLLIANYDASGVIYVNVAGGAAAVNPGSIKLGPGESVEFATWCPSGVVSAIGTIASNWSVLVVEG